METITLLELAHHGTFANAAVPMMPEDSFYGRLHTWTEALHPTWQWLGLILISAIPFVESYGGGFLGVLAGVHPAVAISAGVIGNMISLILVVYLAHWIRGSVLKRRNPEAVDPRKSAKRERVIRIFDKFGVPGVSILGPLALPSQITAPLMVSVGASRNAVMGWMLVSVVLWGAAFGLLGLGFLQLLA
ncbi:hypothetical protein [Nesterenkonia sp. HG001]|uniref:hypothetical protein n=1 Tax=Nesterenkonia sp. HG001 TaxID=2983207 RepID=UPI002AC5F7D8|nr:hypothetical protein [Nesterenkonia sp. HG001]MDZ5077135.1 hypothetical protein [Nesterenkonia sp. HG001]